QSKFRAGQAGPRQVTRAVLLRLSASVVLLCLSACKPPEPINVTAIVGAVLIDGTGGPPLSNSRGGFSRSRVVFAGARTNVVIPQGASEMNGAGKYLVPGLIDVYVRQRTAPTGGYPAEGVVAVRTPDSVPATPVAGEVWLRTGVLGPKTSAEEARRG